MGGLGGGGTGSIKLVKTFTFVNSISVTFCCIVDDIHSGKTKVNCLKYIVKNGTIFPFNIFSWMLISDIKTWTLGKQEFSFNKNL